jgi:LmbE family N-acetylglucosaminyl deacetylase
MLRLLIIGAHPDDCEYHAGGLAALYRRAGHAVKMVSVTSGNAGHQTLRKEELARRRRAEAAAAAAVIDAESDVLDHPDGELVPSIAARRQIIGLIRSYRPDLILTHRPNDYHPDHRYTSQLVQDAAFMVTVPAIVPDVPHLEVNPVIAYLPDDFQKPYPFRPTVAVDVGPVIDSFVEMLHAHTSQFYEWLPFNGRYLKDVPADESSRRDWLKLMMLPRLRQRAERHRDLLALAYGAAHAAKVEYAEAFEPCEYGAPLDFMAAAKLFGFLFKT